MIDDPVKSAEVISLVYISDCEPGIIRQRKGGSFIYFLNDVELKDEEELSRIKKLAIPPAWERVWICSKSNGHLQATGLDSLGRKQYIYHAHWSALRNHTKFYRLKDFGEILSLIRQQLEKDISLPGLPLKKILATVVTLMERSNIRIGNAVYEKLYGSFGLTTLKDKHISIKGSELKFCFIGKKGIEHSISVRNKKLARIVQQSKDIPGKELFQYFDEDNKRCPIDSGMVNDYIKEISGSDFTAKDFRTWAGTVNAFLMFREIGLSETPAEVKQNIVRVLDAVAEKLGNTRSVCKKYYVHPLVISLYECNKLKKYFGLLQELEDRDDKELLTPAEQIILVMLEKEQ